MQNEIIQYIAELDRLYRTGNATEHSYRPALQRLLENVTTELTVTNEPKRIACGAPDYIVTHGDIPLGYIEAKDIGIDLNGKANREQFDRYRESLGNLIITDYLTFQLFKDGEPVVSVSVGKITPNTIEADTAQLDTFSEMLRLFTGYEGQWIRISEHLSKIMAAKARLLANMIDRALASNEENGTHSLNDQLTGFRQVLIHDITYREFADVYAQTIAYGMFAAKLNDKTATIFTRGKAAQLIPPSNPFLRKLFQYIAGYDLDSRISWVVDALADLFNHVDIPAILKEFDKKEHDPIIHFYETFLAEYDPALRKSRGVWYTPQPVVRFIVQAVDDILKKDFGLVQGLADASTVTKEHPSLPAQTYHRVQILDPAAGTGTFLSEVVNNIYAHFKTQQGLWNGYVKEHLIPRMNGFEILMASYTMAHLKLDMLLQQTGYKPTDNKRLRIYLTNSLEEAHPKTETLFAQWLSDESNEASSIKQDVPVMVVLGNPPYSGESQNKSTDRKKRNWIETKLDIYKYDDKGIKIPNTKWINNDYVKFIRFGQYFIEKNGGGILAYITDNSFLDSSTFKGVRWNLLQTFDNIYILNLHGKTEENIPNKIKDDNVFDITEGVSINIFIKTGLKDTNALANVYYCDLYGKRNEKYSFLLNNDITSVKWNKLPLDAPHFFFITKNLNNQLEYEKGFGVQELFLKNQGGICSKRDATAFQYRKQDIQSALTDFKNLPVEQIKERYKTEKTESRDKKTQYAQSNVINSGIDDKFIKVINYRPFDFRWTYFTDKSKGFLAYPVYEIMQHFINKQENIGLITPKINRQISTAYMFITNKITDLHILDSEGDSTYIFPLYLYPTTDKLFSDEKRKPNLNEAIVAEISQRLGLPFTEEKEETENTFAPIDILDYIYAVLHSPSYRERYKEFLKIDFPRVPYPQDATQFRKLATLGAKLRRLHLMEGVEPSPDMATYPKEGSNEVEKTQYVSGKVYINDIQYFDNVPPEAWEFYIGGYQPAQKWLKDRKRQILGYDDIVHYQQIIQVLKETGSIMNSISTLNFRTTD
ncbi:MAG: N-6 DNA methylase [Prevotella sp.]|jgi:predicted helicase|nr:N-6 DNA methylase [Prevotella sp.]